MRFQQGVEDSPTREPISATDSEASSCRTASIFRSMASMRSDLSKFLPQESVRQDSFKPAANRVLIKKNIPIQASIPEPSQRSGQKWPARRWFREETGIHKPCVCKKPRQGTSFSDSGFMDSG